MDIKEALLHPEEIFSTPKEVLGHPEFTKEQKIEILRSWAYEVNECTVAEEEEEANAAGYGQNVFNVCMYSKGYSLKSKQTTL